MGIRSDTHPFQIARREYIKVGFNFEFHGLLKSRTFETYFTLLYNIIINSDSNQGFPRTLPLNRPYRVCSITSIDETAVRLVQAMGVTLIHPLKTKRLNPVSSDSDANPVSVIRRHPHKLNCRSPVSAKSDMRLASVN